MDNELMEGLNSENSEKATPEAETEATNGESVDYEAKSKAFYAQLKEEKAKRKELEEKLASIAPKKDESPDLPVRELLSLKAEGYSEKEILTLHSYAVSMRKSISDVAKDPFIKSGIEAERQKAREEGSIPTPSNRVGVVGNKEFSAMTTEEKAKKWAELNAK